MKLYAFLGAIVLLSSCMSRNKLLILYPRSLFDPLVFIDSLYTYQASGPITLNVKGERFYGQVVIQKTEKNNFECHLYNPFSMIVATIRYFDDSVQIEAGEDVFKTNRQNPISIISFFSDYPFSFNDFIRILTGRIIRRDCLERESLKQSIGTVIDTCESTIITLIRSRRAPGVKSIVYTSKDEDPWKLSLSDFKNGLFKDITFQSENNDFLSLKLKHFLR